MQSSIMLNFHSVRLDLPRDSFDSNDSEKIDLENIISSYELEECVYNKKLLKKLPFYQEGEKELEVEIEKEESDFDFERDIESEPDYIPINKIESKSEYKSEWYKSFYKEDQINRKRIFRELPFYIESDSSFELDIDNKIMKDDLFNSAKLGDIDKIKAYHYSGVDISIEYNNAFMLACQNNRLELAKWIYSVNYKVDTEYFHFSNLYMVCYFNLIDMAKWLLSIEKPKNISFLLVTIHKLGHMILFEYLLTIYDIDGTLL